MRSLFIIASCLLVASGPAQDSRPNGRALLTKLWLEQRYGELRAQVLAQLESTPDAADLWIMVAEASLKLEDFPTAVASFERGIKIAPALAGSAINLGFAYLKVDRVGDARRVFESFSKDVNKGRAAKAHYGLGLAFLAEDRAADARAAFTESVRLDQDDPRAAYRLGQLELQAGETAKAVDHFKSALDADELHRGAAYGLARAYALLGDPAESARWAERHKQILETDDAVTTLIGLVGGRLNSPRSSKNEVAEADPAGTRLKVARRLLEGGAPRKAAFWFKAVLALDSGNEEARRGLALTQSRPESRR